MNFLNFSKKELKVVSLILFVISTATFFNLRLAVKKSRDFQRKEDLFQITKLISKFQDKYGQVPKSKDGFMVACNPKPAEGGGLSFDSCRWGEDMIIDERLPVDPQNSKGRKYHYISNGKRFQIFASLEDKNEVEYDEKIVKRNIQCGKFICNMGRASQKVPLEITLDEFEQKLLEESKN